MRTLLTVLTLTAAAWVCPTLQAADQAKKQALAEGVQDLNLTDEQESRIADIRKEFQPKVHDLAKDLASIVKDEVKKVRAVLTQEQKEKLQANKEERKHDAHEGLCAEVAHLRQLDLTDGEVTQITAIRKEYRPKIASALKGLTGILNDEQKTARAEALKAGKKRREVLAALNLSEEQKEKVQAVGKELASLVREEMEKIGDVLSAGQKETLQDVKEETGERVRDRLAHRIANLKDLNLTDEQKARIADIRKEYRPRVQEAGNKLRATIREQVAMVAAAIKG